jgi:hypothetical protein
MEMSNTNSRFSKNLNGQVDEGIEGTISQNTTRSKAGVWKQFRESLKSQENALFQFYINF